MATTHSCATCGRCSKSNRVEVVLNGHDHLYERFARQTADGLADPVDGIRQFIAGTGGAELYTFVRSAPNSEERIMKSGVVRFTLRPAQVEWEFLAIDGSIERSRPRYLPLAVSSGFTSAIN